jgi:predicted nucleic acid-binding protein
MRASIAALAVSNLIERAARLLQGYELMYWDSMVEAAGL